MGLIDEDFIKNVYSYDSKYTEYRNQKAKFNTKIASDMKHNGEIVDVLGFLKGKDIYNDRYIVRFNDNTINDNIYSNELDFDYVDRTKNKNKERDVR